MQLPKYRLALGVAVVFSSLMLAGCPGDSTNESSDSETANSDAQSDGNSSSDEQAQDDPSSGDDAHGNSSSADGPQPNPSFTEEARNEGLFSDPFSEPTLVVDGEVVETDRKCVTNEEGMEQCKPAAGTMAMLADGRILYLNALEGTENVELSIVAEFGEVSVNDQSRVLSLDDNDQPSWTKPEPLRAGANPDGNDSETLTRGTPFAGLIDTSDNTEDNDGALFCSDVVGLADGSVMAVGGTDYYSEPGIDDVGGVVELEGIENSRIFDAEQNRWRQSGDMNYGRWYPSMVTLGSGEIFVASGVTKLLKPVYPENPLQSGRNVVQTETYAPCEGTWSQNPSTADRSLPLYPRLHLLPNGHVFYNAGGQAFNPFGQGYDQALWNIVATYNPDNQRWTDIGYAGLPLRLDEAGLGQLTSTLNVTNLSLDQVDRLVGDVLDTANDTDKLLSSFDELDADEDQVRKAVAGGMRGSTSSTMMPLTPNEDGEYDTVEFLTAGGVPSYALLTNPGGYLPTAQSRIDTVEINSDQDGDIDYVSRLTGDLNQPRWYGTNVLMPDGSVMVFSGANRDGVVGPGLDGPIRTAERFDPETEEWTEMATAHQPRTYHNTAVLMPDGRVMIGGHAPINTAYLSNIDLQEVGFSPNDGRDPSFEIYTPPYATRDDRPEIENAPETLGTGDSFTIKTDDPDIDKVMLIRRTVMTHVIDGDQRAVELSIDGRNGNDLEVTMPDNQNVVPAGEYMLFVSRDSEEGRVPSTSASVRVTNPEMECLATDTADGEA